MLPITEIAAKLGIGENALEPYGRTKAKLDIGALRDLPRKGKLILVTAINPTPAGEGTGRMFPAVPPALPPDLRGVPSNRGGACPAVAGGTSAQTPGSAAPVGPGGRAADLRACAPGDSAAGSGGAGGAALCAGPRMDPHPADGRTV